MLIAPQSIIPKTLLTNNMDWLDEILNTPEPVTTRQRRACYRLGMSPWFVRKHIKTKNQASNAIQELIKVNRDTRGAGHENQTLVSPMRSGSGPIQLQSPKD